MSHLCLNFSVSLFPKYPPPPEKRFCILFLCQLYFGGYPNISYFVSDVTSKSFSSQCIWSLLWHALFVLYFFTLLSRFNKLIPHLGKKLRILLSRSHLCDIDNVDCFIFSYWLFHKSEACCFLHHFVEFL